VQKKEKNHLKIGELPELRIVEIADVVFHEQPHEERVQNLVGRFKEEGVLKHPPIVGRAEGWNKRILLDGANRVTALRNLGYRFALVQEIDLSDDRLLLDTWHHAVEHLDKGEIISHAGSVEGVTVNKGELPIDSAGVLCVVRLPEGDTVTLTGSDELFARVEELVEFTDLYHRFAFMDRVSYTNMDHLRRNYAHLSALVLFRRFTKQDLLRLCENGDLLPSGVTRIMLPKRALRFNLSLDLLRSDSSLKAKNDRLEESIQKKISGKTIRFYREPTFHFDD
jgi:hypothetical protein